MSKSEQVLAAVKTILDGLAATLGLTVQVERDGEDPEEVTTDLYVVLESGDPGDPDAPLGRDGPYSYNHEIPVSIFAEHAEKATRRTNLEAAMTAIETALDADPELGGLANGFDFAHPESEEIANPNATTLLAATLLIEIEYSSTTRI